MEITREKREGIATICLMAAFADGQQDDAERERIKEVFDSLGAGFSPSLYTRVVMGQADLDAAAAALDTPALRTLAYEMAVGVCDADGATTAPEKAFLERLRTTLGLDAAASHAFLAQGDALATLPLDGADPMPVGSASTPDDALRGDPVLDPLILKYAILNGGLELLPQSVASMAIISLQMKLVYRVGQHHGYSLDQGHIRELLATVGVGMTSQMVENVARKIVGGLLKGTLGKMAGRVGSAATGAAVTFASTYAVGHVARSYYGAGRKLEPQILKRLFAEHLERGKALFAAYKPAVEDSARTTDVGALLATVRG